MILNLAMSQEFLRTSPLLSDVLSVEVQGDQLSGKKLKKKGLRNKIAYIIHIVFNLSGPDWKWDNQDGGEGNIGRVYRLQTPTEIYVSTFVFEPVVMKKNLC